MIKVTIYRQGNDFTGFHASDHASYAEAGEDIVCAAVSALIRTCVRSIEQLTPASYQMESDEENAVVIFRLTGEADVQSQLLIRSLIIGLSEIEENYSAYLDLIIEEV